MSKLKIVFWIITLQFHMWLPAFQRNMLPLSSGWKWLQYT